ncbi:MAG: nucleoside-diphosphate sugar epimerase/dehydratase, partial [Kordiimonas sp.]
MVRIFRHYVSPVKLTLAITDFAALFASVYFAEWLRYNWAGLTPEYDLQSFLAKLLLPLIGVPILLGVGGYESDALRDTRVFAVRLFVAALGTSVLMSAVLYFLPMLPLWRSILVLTIVAGGLSLYTIHWLFLHFADYNFLSRRVIILGDGEAAEELVSFAKRAPEAGLNIVKV